MAQRSVYLGKENVPPSSLAAKRMKMVIMNEDDDGLVREATPKKNPFIKPAGVVVTTQVSTNVPLVPLAISSPEAEKKEEEEDDDDEVVVIRPRSPRSPSASVPSSIALEAQQLLTSLSSSTDISATTLPPPSEVSVSPPLTDVEQPSSEQVIEETTPPSDVVTSTIEETKEETTESGTLITPSSPSIAQAPVENESKDETNQEEAAPEIPIVIESENTKEDVKVSDDVNISSEPQAESEVPSSSSSDLVISEEKKAENVEEEEEEKMKKADEIKKVEEARAQELAARSIARIEAEAAAQARRTQLEAKLAQLETLQLPLSDAAQATRSAVEERIAAVEEAWRRKVESKEAIVQSVESRSLAKRSDSTLPSSSSATTTSECPTSPSIEERKRRIERLRNERLEMKMRLDLSRSTNPPRKDISNNNNKKKSLRWADANGEKLTVATSFLVVNEEDEQPTHRSTVPPPLPEEAPPSKIPARYLEGTAAVGDN